MRHHTSFFTRDRAAIRRAIVLSALAVAAGRPLQAQGSGNGYLFGAPSAQITLRGGYSQANARSELFDQVTSDLTLSRRDFAGLTGGATIAIHAGPRFDVTLDADVAGMTGRRSEYRGFEDQGGQPIEQTTDFVRVPVLVGARFNLTDPGRSVGRLAWIPARLVPWVGAGVGAAWYRFRQQGDFIDFNTVDNQVVTLQVSSSGWAPAAQASLGADLTLSPRVALTGGARYTWSRAKLGEDFDQAFDRLDLSGVAVTLGLTFRL